MSMSLEVDYDPYVWIELDLALVDADEAELDDWAVRTARSCYEESEVTASDRQLTVLATQLREFAGRLLDAGGFGMAFIHLRYPEEGPLTAALIGATDAGDGSEESLRAMGGADDPDLIEPPDVQWIETQIGVAMRVWRYAADPELGRSAVYAALTYVWHLPQHDADIRLSASSFDLGELTLAVEDIDELARSVSLVS